MGDTLEIALGSIFGDAIDLFDGGILRTMTYEYACFLGRPIEPLLKPEERESWKRQSISGREDS